MSPKARFDGWDAVVTGAGGFIGAAICRALVAEGARVRGVEIAPSARETVEATGAEFIVGDVTDPDGMRAPLEGADAVLHTAAFIHEGSAMDDFIALNVRGTVNLLDRAEEAGIERFVHLSSVVVYGYEDEATQDEESPLRTVGIPYLDTKSASDRVARRRGAVVIRPGDVYGPGSVPWTVRPLQLAREGRLAIPAPGTARMLPVFVDDLVEAVLLGALEGERGRSYAAWSGEDLSFREYFDRLLAAVPDGGSCRVLPIAALRAASLLSAGVARARGVPPEFGPNALTFVNRRGSVSTERIREELGWEPAVDLAEGLRRIGQWVTRPSAGASP